jgi:hypothetical protein
MNSVLVDPAELSALRMIAKAAAKFVEAIDTDEQIRIVAEQAVDEWVSLADTVIVQRQAAKIGRDA